MTYLKFIVDRTARRASDMLHNCLRNIVIAITCYLCAVRYVNIFQIGKMRLIKQPDLVKYIPAVDRGSCTSRKNLPALLIVLCRLVLTTGIRPSKRTVVISCIVYDCAVLHLNHLGSAGKAVRHLLHRSDKLCHKFLSTHCIIV